MSSGNIIVEWPLNGNSPQNFLNGLITPPTTARETLYRALVDGLVAAGIWALLDVLFVFAAADHLTSVTDLVTGVNRAFWPVDDATFTVDQGMTPLGTTHYLDTGFNLSAGTNFQQNSASIFVWNLVSGTLPGEMIGTGVSSKNHISPCLTSNNHTQWAINSSIQVDSSGIATDAQGFWAMNRSGATASAIYQNGVQLATSNVASGAPDNKTLIFNGNNQYQIAVMGAGGSLNSTQLGASATASFYGLLRTYLLGVGLSV
jgi:hypothetical protein